MAHPNATHGMSTTPEYRAWRSMRSRVLDSRNAAFASYGGRGIDMDPRWSSFEAFIADMGRRPSDSHSIDRIDNDLGYWPRNCRWATPLEQICNRRSTLLITFNGQTLPIADWSRRSGIELETLRYRIKHGWPADRALTTPSTTNRKRHGNQVNDHA